MTKSKPVAPKRPKSVLAWCVASGGELLPEFMFNKRTKGALWYASMKDGALIRVEIRPAPKRKGAKP